MPSDFTKRAGIDKPRGMSKLVMLCNRAFYYDMVQKKVGGEQARRIIWYHFMFCFESSFICGESGAHIHVVDMEIAKKPVGAGQDMWPISVTLNISLDEYRKMRKNKRFSAGLSRVKKAANVAEPMPGFKEIKG